MRGRTEGKRVEESEKGLSSSEKGTMPSVKVWQGYDKGISFFKANMQIQCPRQRDAGCTAKTNFTQPLVISHQT